MKSALLSLTLGSLLSLFMALSASAVKIHFHPQEIIAYKEAPDRNYYSLMLHNVEIHNTSGSEIRVDEIRIDAIRNGRITNSLFLSADDLLPLAQKMRAYQEGGILELYDFYFQTSRYLPEGTILSGSTLLAADEAILVTQNAILAKGLPEAVRITATYNQNKSTQRISRSIAVRDHKSANAYIFPLRGIWYNHAGASIRTHHRWVTNEEFALDLVRLGSDGADRKGEKEHPADYYSYGENVLAIADGVIVGIESKMPETYEFYPVEGESKEALETRTAEMQGRFMTQGIYAAAGNYVSIQHANGEFSHSLHLAEGSVHLKVGDKVKQGDVIGRLGHSGNSTGPHLHFQVTDGADLMYSRGLPTTFINAAERYDLIKDQSPASGWFIETTDNH